MTIHGLKKRDELNLPEAAEGDQQLEAKRESGDIVKCVVVRCHETKCIFGHVIPQKGPDEDNFTVNLITGDIAWMGHVRLLLKTDQEKSLVALVSRALLTLRIQVTDLESVNVEHSQAYDSQASGGTEVGIRSLRGLYRTLRLCLEVRPSSPRRDALSSRAVCSSSQLESGCWTGTTWPIRFSRHRRSVLYKPRTGLTPTSVPPLAWLS